MIPATDLGVARAFYGDRIGLEVVIDSGDFLTFRCGGDSRTTVVLTNRGLWDEESKRLHREGWEPSFDNFDRVLAE
jgi:hypothetical protein